MNRLWLFNPENDIALAHGYANFTPPPAALKLRQSGEMLPLWMASDGDRVLCHGVNDRWLAEIRKSYGIEVDIWNRVDFRLLPTPWGWSKASRATFVNEGFSIAGLPDDDELDLYRKLSHRRTATRINEIVKDKLPFEIYPGAVEINDADVLSHLVFQKGQVVIKAPWSSSGRGIRFVDEEHLNQAVTAAAGTIRKQGSVLVEDFVDSHFDFALLFYCNKGECSFCGYSLFDTDASNGQYGGNIVASQEVLRSRIDSRLVPGQLDMMTGALTEALSGVLGSRYTGPVGVDMLTDSLGKMHIVEVNLRYTMGFLAMGLSRYVHTEGHFYIRKDNADIQPMPVIENGKLVKGEQCLTPPGGEFSFIFKA